jgi:hypothetical protein
LAAAANVQSAFEGSDLNFLGPNVSTAGRRAGERSIALGVERFALIPFKAPAVTVLAVLALAVLAVLGIQRIRIDDSLSQLFRSDSPAFHQFEQVSRDFPSAEYDALIVVTGKSLLDRESVEKLRSLVTDVQLIDGARGVISMFSAREPAADGGLPASPPPRRSWRSCSRLARSDGSGSASTCSST